MATKLTILNIRMLSRGTHFVLAACFAGLMLTGCGSRSASGDGIAGVVSKYQFNIKDGRAILSVTFPSAGIEAGARIPLTRPSGAFIELTPDFESGGTLFVLSTPLASLGGNGLPVIGLPDGRPLPGVRNGRLPATAANLPVFGSTYMYMGSDVFGLFIPFGLGSLPLTVTVRIRDDKGNLLGTLAAIPKGSTGAVSGILFLFPMEGTAAATNLFKSL